MYRFLTIQGSCGKPYDIQAVEQSANQMAATGFDLVQVYETRIAGCFGAQSVLVMVFRHP